MRKNNEIEIQEDVRIPGTDVILEKGDRIEVLDEEQIGGFPRNGIIQISTSGYIMIGVFLNTPYPIDSVRKIYEKVEKEALKVLEDLKPKVNSEVLTYSLTSNQVTPEIIDVYSKVGNTRNTVLIGREFFLQTDLVEDLPDFIREKEPELRRIGITAFL